MSQDKPLTRRQKAVLCQMAAKAYAKSAAGLAYPNVGEYRHAVAAEVCGLAGLTEATQQHYVPLYNAFARAAGLREMADRTPHNQLEREVHLLRQEMQRYEFTEGYVLPIMMDRLRLSMPMPFDSLCLQLGATGVQQVKFTIINRGRQKLRALEAAHDLPPAVEYHTPATMPPDRLAEHFGAELMEPAPAARRSSRKGVEV